MARSLTKSELARFIGREASTKFERALSEPNAYYEFGMTLGVPADVVTEILSTKASLEDRLVEIADYSSKEKKTQSSEVIAALRDLYMKDKEPPVTIIQESHLVLSPPVSVAELTIKVQDEIAQSLDKIKEEFACLVMDIQDALEDEAKIDRLIRFLKLYLGDTFKPHCDPCRNIEDIFNGLEEHYCFINYKILRVLAGKFVHNKTTLFLMKEYGRELNEWLESTTIQQFKAAVEKAVHPVSTDPSPNQCPVVLRLEGEWMKITIKNLWKLLEYFFGENSSIFTRIRIRKGSVIIEMAAPQSEILSILTFASRKCTEMRYLGILSVQVGCVLFHAQMLSFYFPDPFTFELGLSAAIVFNRSPALIECLLEIGADPNARTPSGFTLLMVASKYCNTNAISLLLKYNADPHKFDSQGLLSVIHLAAGSGQLQDVKLLLKAGVSVNYHNSNKFTPLMAAAFEKQDQMVKFLLQNGADVDAQNIDGDNALLLTCRCEHTSTAKLLLTARANPNPFTNDGFTALLVACIKSCGTLVELLLRFNADPNIASKSGHTPLMIACILSHHKIIKLLLQSGAYVNSQTSDGTTALYLASYFNDNQTISLLLNANADINIYTNQVTPFVLICYFGNEETVQLFLEAGADADPILGIYKPLHAAAYNNNTNIVAALLNAGANPNATIMNYNLTPLHFACDLNNEDIVQLLLEAKANTNVRSSSGCTPLCVAVSRGNINIVEALLAAGADVELENDNDRGWRPIFFAAITGHLPILNLLLKHGASLKGDKFGIPPQAVAALMGHVEAQVRLNQAKSSIKKDVSGNNSTPELDIQTRNNITSHYKRFRSDLSSSIELFQKTLPNMASTLSNMASFATNISQYV